MNSTLVIARMTFLEARRNRIIWSLFFFALVLVLTSFLFQEVTIASYDRIVRDVGMAAINVFGVLLATFLGVSVVAREIERRTVYVILSRPLSRVQYLFGKLLGVWLTVAVCLLLMLVAFIVEAVVYRGELAPVIFQAFWTMQVEFLVLASFAMFASTFTSSAVAAFMTISLYVIGHLSEDLYFFGRKSGSLVLKKLGAVFFFAVPNLEKLNLKPEVSALQHVTALHVLSVSVYGLLYAVVFITAAVAIFVRRDLK